MNIRLSVNLIAVAILFALGACRSAPTTPAAAAAAGYECRAEKQTGSNFPVKVCTTKAQRDAQREDAKTATGRLQRFPGSPCNPQIGPCR